MASAATKSEPVPLYRIGEIVQADIITPVELAVFDAAKTEQLRHAEEQRVSPVFRFSPDAAVMAEKALRMEFATMRERFLGLIEARFKRRILATKELEIPLFAAAMDAARTTKPEFPLTRSLAELWALGDAGDVVRDEWAARLSELTRLYVSGDDLRPAEALAGETVLIVRVPPGAAVDLVTLEKAGRIIPRSELQTLSGLRQQLAPHAGSSGNTVDTFLTGLVKPNCVFDADLTRQSRTRRATAINAVDRYAAGQRIAGRGQVVDGRIQRALAELRARTEGAQIRATAEEEKARIIQEATLRQNVLARAANVQAADARAQVETTSTANRRLMAGIVAASAALAGAVMILFLVWRRKAPPVTLAVGTNDSGELLWRERALVAEARAEKATALLRARLLPQLARWMVSEMFQRLLSHRSLLASTHQQAEREVAELAARLDSIHAPLEDRLRAYERRIAELEAELALKEEQNRALLQAKIETARRRLEQERGGIPPSWN